MIKVNFWGIMRRVVNLQSWPNHVESFPLLEDYEMIIGVEFYLQSPNSILIVFSHPLFSYQESSSLPLSLFNQQEMHSCICDDDE